MERKTVIRFSILSRDKNVKQLAKKILKNVKFGITGFSDFYPLNLEIEIQDEKGEWRGFKSVRSNRK